MMDYIKKYVRTIRLNSFHPLCETEIGKNAIMEFNYPPFIDASCRREPDLENQWPSITSLCRQESFAPNLFPNDIVVYVTVKGKWSDGDSHYRLVAILEVIDRKESHIQAKSWYLSQGYDIPSNCIVDGNPPHRFCETAGNYETKKDIKHYLKYSKEIQERIGAQKVAAWDQHYRKQSRKSGCFNTKPVYVNLVNPPELTDDSIREIFGGPINTRTPNIISKDEFKKIAHLAGINFLQHAT
jgi:hypothetical protein